MANIIAFMNTKGGVGKTTLSINLAHALALDNQKVLLIDGDVQASAREWFEEVEKPIFTVVGYENEGLDKQINQLSQSYDWVIIDGSAKQEKANVGQIKSADLIVIPVSPSPLDLWATSGLVETIKTRQEMTDGIPVAGFQISKAIKGTKVSSEIKDAVSAYGFELLNGSIHQRVEFVKSLSLGKTVFDVCSKDSDEIFEVQHMKKQIVKAFES